MVSASGTGCSGLHRQVEVPPAGVVEKLELGLFLGQLDFQLGALLELLLHLGAKQLETLFTGAEGFPRARLFGSEAVDAGFELKDLLGQEGAIAVELDVVGQQAGALLAEALDLGGQGVPAAGGFAELLLEACHGAALAAVPLFHAGQAGAHLGVLLADGLGLAFQRLQFGALGFQRLLALGTEGFLFFHRGLVGLALPGRLFRVAAEAVELEPGDGDAGIGAREVLGEFAHLRFQAHAVLFAGLLQAAQALQVGF